MKIKIISPVALLFSLSLISCGGGDGDSAQTGYTGSTAQASVSAANKDSLAVTATAGANQAIADDSAQGAITGLRPAPVSSFMLDLSSRIKMSLTTANRTANQPVPGVCSPGSVDAVANQQGTEITVVFTNCTVIGGNGEVVNGTVFVNGDQNLTNITMRFVNFTVLYLGESYAINATISCNSTSCTWTSDFTGPDGRTYRAQNVTVTLAGANSFNVTATVFDPDHGFIAISGNVTYGGCLAGVPQSGNIAFSGSENSSGSVVFTGCDGFTVTVDNVATNYLWANILP